MAKTTKHDEYGEYYEIPYEMFMALRGYGVYQWRRKEGKSNDVLYVGESTWGINRPTDRDHHIIFQRECVRDTDHFRLYRMENIEQQHSTEKKMIETIKPFLNDKDNPDGPKFPRIDCDKCRHMFTKYRVRKNLCLGNCDGDDSCPCKKEREREEEKLALAKDRAPKFDREHEDKPKKPNGVGSLIR